MRQRDLILVILTTVAVIATTAAPLLAADTVQLATYFLVTFQRAANLTAFHLAGVAVGAVVAVPSSRVWGKRHVFLLGAILMTVASAWGGSTHGDRNYASLVWARVIQGVALAPFESLTNAVVGDLYFVHERGPRMAFVNTAIFGGAFLTPVFVGMIAKNMGWQWSFYLLAIFMGVGFLALFFFVPETAYDRAHDLNTDVTGKQNLYKSSPAESVSSDEKELRATSEPVRTSRGAGAGPGADDDTSVHVANGSTGAGTGAGSGAGASEPSSNGAGARAGPREPYMQRLRIFNGRQPKDSFWKLLLRPFPLFLHPAVIWGCLMQGVIIGWTVMVGVVISFIFLAPPLFFSEERVGKLYTAAFVGALIGLVLSGAYTEVVTNFMVRRNRGVYEPEFRILLVIPTLIFTATGLYGFGITANNVLRYGWLIPDVFFGFIVASMVMGAVASAQYLLDAHRDIDVEIFTTLIIFKNIFSFILAYFSYTWVFSSGIRVMFVTFGSIEVGICCLAVPMYVLGKRNRAFFAKRDILKMCKLR